MSPEIRLDDPSGVDLGRHAVIEASAGTGKTFAIERLVLRLIAEKGISLDRILLVTFTEKAAGEMRERVRDALARALGDGALPAGPLQAALARFGEAQIFTLHGFCHRILRAHAFENGQPLRLELLEDPALPARLLREEMRACWPRLFGDRLEELLRLSDFPGDGLQESPWTTEVLELASRHRPACGDLLLPGPAPDMAGWFQMLADSAAEARLKARSSLGPISSERIEDSDIWRSYLELPIRKDVRLRRAERVLGPLLRWVSADSVGLSGFLELCEACSSLAGFQEQGFSILLKPSGAKAGRDPAALCPALAETAGILDGLIALLHPARRVLTSFTVERVQDAFRRHKEERGLLGYEDMLLRLDEALDPERNPQAGRLLALLRERYLWALVDEFQDTDSIQWRIFQRIFTGAGRRLVLVGDPKQAIYRFRGADLQAYLGARGQLLQTGQALLYRLPRNWRSRRELVEFFNAIFPLPCWFGGGGRVGYAAVDAPPPAREMKVHRDATGRAPVTVIDLGGPLKVGLLRARLAAFIALEIERLLGLDAGGEPRLLLGREGRCLPLEAGHIAVLVRKRQEAGGIERALAARGIPYTHYKKTGLWLSREAVHFQVLLSALSRPNDPRAFREALLTPFFRSTQGGHGTGPIPPSEVRLHEEAGPGHPAARIFAHWLDLAGRRRWSALCRALLEETGLLLDLAGRPGGERKIADYRHIAQVLEEQALARDLDAADLAERIRELRRGAEDAGLHRLETEEPRVQIMTIHAAKGLEFPVVFLAGGFTRGPRSGWFEFHDPRGTLVRDLARSPEHAAAHAAEELDEERRLYYVAMTRAMVRLYLPLAPAGGPLAGPLPSLLRPALEACLPGLEARGLAARLPWEGRGRPPGPDGALLPPDPLPAPPPAAAAPLTLDDPLPPPWRVKPFERILEIRSFSGLRARERAVETRGDGFRGDDERAPFEAPAGLPPGPHTGEMVHALLERISFEEAAAAGSPDELDDPDRSPSTRTLLAELLPAAYPELVGGDPARLELRRRQALELAWAALHAPLPGLDITLCRIPRRARLAETEFLLPLPWTGPALRPDRFLTGVIDLLFFHAGKVFLLDWKSNYLPEGYAPERLEDAMAAEGYELQLRIYSLALARWLEGSHCRPGGVFYSFLRGLDPTRPGQGILFRPPRDPADLEASILERAGWEEP